MKKHLATAFLFALFGRAMGQGSGAIPDTSGSSNDAFIFTFGLGGMFNHLLPGTMTITFPYVFVPTGSNVGSNETFSGSMNGYYDTALIMGGLNMEFLLRNNIWIRTGLGMVSIAGGDIFILTGAYYSIPIQPSSRKPQRTESHWFFRAGLDNILGISSNGVVIGTIDNSNGTVQIQQLYSGPQFTVSGNGRRSSTYNTEFLDIILHQSVGALIPDLSLAFQHKWFFASAEPAWFFPYFETQSLAVEQDDGNGHSKKLGRLPFNSSPITTSLNNRVLQRQPSMSGPYLALNVGINIPWHRSPNAEQTRKVLMEGVDFGRPIKNKLSNPASEPDGQQ